MIGKVMVDIIDTFKVHNYLSFPKDSNSNAWNDMNYENLSKYNREIIIKALQHLIYNNVISITSSNDEFNTYKLN